MEQKLVKALKNARKPTSSRIHRVVDILAQEKYNNTNAMDCLKNFFKKGFKPDDSRLSIVYVVDSILKWEKKHFQNNYTPHIRAWSPELFEIAGQAEEGMDRPKLSKTLSIWEEKKIMESEFINKLRNKLNATDAAPSPSISTGEIDNFLKELQCLGGDQEESIPQQQIVPKPARSSQNFQNKLKKVKVQESNAATRRFAPYQRKPISTQTRARAPDPRPQTTTLLSQLQQTITAQNTAPPSQPLRHQQALPPQNFNGLLNSSRVAPTQQSVNSKPNTFVPQATYTSQPSQKSAPPTQNNVKPQEGEYRQPPPPPPFNPPNYPSWKQPMATGPGYFPDANRSPAGRGNGFHGFRGRGVDDSRGRFTNRNPRGRFGNSGGPRGRFGNSGGPRGRGRGFNNPRGGGPRFQNPRGNFNTGPPRGDFMGSRGRGYGPGRGAMRQRGRGFNRGRNFSRGNFYGGNGSF